MSSTAPVHVLREYHALPPPDGYEIPTPSELVNLCTAVHPRGPGYNMGVAHPPEAPVFWIKYGSSVFWNEIPAQMMAYEELRRLKSPVRAPRMFYAGQIESPPNSGCRKWYLVMDFVPGKTAGEWLKATEDPVRKDTIYSLIALALSELHRIPIPPESRPAAIDGGKIRHVLFDCQEAPRHYENVQQLEDHLNLFLKITKRKSRVQGLSREPMVFCYSDVWLGNFIIDDNDRVSVIDFADASILPSSFSKYALSPGEAIRKIKRDINSLVQVPTTDGVDNTDPLIEVYGPMVMGWSSFASIGRRLPGGQVEIIGNSAFTSCPLPPKVEETPPIPPELLQPSSS